MTTNGLFIAIPTLLAGGIMQEGNMEVESFLMDIDEFSEDWGAMKQRQESMETTMTNGFDAINIKLDKFLEGSIATQNLLTSAHDRIDSMESKLNEAHKNGEDWKSTKKSATIVAGGTGFTIAGFLAWLGKVMS